MGAGTATRGIHPVSYTHLGLLKLTTFDYDNATVASISAEISGSLVIGKEVNPMAVGDIIAFKTASASTAGADRIGVMRIIAVSYTHL